ncbi:ATP synthase F1 subunit delta [Bartonella sp. CB189]|uniref:ATP synthase F1 subunit delta n=1 Tax=Bartonella sp. CB189 TaxID=3112254 RepID=UPI002F961D74
MSGSFSLIPLPLVDQRYAQALFDLVQEDKLAEDIEKAVELFLTMLDHDEDLKRFVQNPFSSVKEQVDVIHSICDSLEFADEDTERVIRNFLCVIAVNRRLCALSGILHAFQRRIALSRREIPAQIISARALSPNQEEELRVALEGVVEGKVLLCISVDPNILGGLIVRLGSFQIDTSLVAQLSSLKLALKKEVS